MTVNATLLRGAAPLPEPGPVPPDPPVFILLANPNWAPWLPDTAYQKIPIGVTGQVLTVQSDGSINWQNSAAGFANPMTTSQDLIVGGTGGAPTRLPIGTPGQVLTDVGGVIAWANTSASLTNPMTTANDLIIGGTGGTPTRLAAGPTGTILQSTAGGLAWVAFSTGNPMTTLGDIITGGTLGVETRLGIGTTGQVLTVSGGVPVWAPAPGGLTNPMTTTGDMITATTGGTPVRLPVSANNNALLMIGGTPTWQDTQATVIVQLSGDTSGATDTAAINAALALAGRVELLQGVYYINSPLKIPSNTILVGATPTTYSGDNVQGAWTGTEIHPVASFSLGAFTFPAAVFLGDGLGTSTFEGVGISDLLVNGTNAPSGLAGVVAYGPVQAITMRRMGVWRAKADGIGLYTSGSGKPDGGNFDTIIVQSCNSGNGFVVNGADFDFAAVHVQGCALDGFVITGANNTFRGCRADHNTNGYTTGKSATAGVFNTIRLVGCSTQGNNSNGLNVTTGESTGVSLTAPVVAEGCTFQGDGANGGAGGGGFAGVAFSGTTVAILNGCTVTVDTTDAPGGSPQYAIATAAAGSGSGKPQLVQIMGGIYGANSGTIVNDAAPSTLISYSFHGWSGGPLTTGTPLVLTQLNPL